MSETEAVNFAQITDVHVGERGLNPREAEWNLRWAINEIAALEPQPRAIIATADLVNAGSRSELEEYSRLVAESAVPIYALPANHDLWGEKDETAWVELVGPLRQRVDIGELAVLLWDDILRVGGGWKGRLGDEQGRWLEAELAQCEGRPVVVAHHAPLLPTGDDFHDVWAGSNGR
ncbi:MAG: metallophosphoesterase, partial [Armatimonadetes bacterium]|nr:metallophosphoesterase [Armatimonadota bacterium]